MAHVSSLNSVAVFRDLFFALMAMLFRPRHLFSCRDATKAVEKLDAGRLDRV